MTRRSPSAATVALTALAVAACAAAPPKTLVDPFPLRFPLVEVGALEIEGHVVGQPRAHDGVLTFATDDGFVTAVVIPSRAVLWRRPGQAEAGGTILQTALACGGPGPAGPDTPLLRVEGDRLRAFDAEGGMIWEFAADGRITAEPSVSSGRVYFGTASRTFYCLKAETGKAKWRRRLQGAPLQRAVVQDRTVVVPALNSVVYFLSARGGSILSWETVPSRVVYELAPAGPVVLVSSASPTVVALDPRTGKRVGQYEAPGPLVAGAVWTPPYVVAAVEDPDTGLQRLVFLRSR
ncbi:MAG: PQQ-like beta-propeller repeat protein [Candidatus Aminicenantes bacterium]|nr:PQQ-like beta-propeller repeat protein [Candidatus Aminicenantes bacterium]